MATAGSPSEEREISLGPGTAKIPERLLIAHARGRVLFISGAGSSRPSRLPDFRGLVLDAYAHLDAPAYRVLKKIPVGVSATFKVPTAGLSHKQRAEIARFVNGEYDVVLGMLERRMDGADGATLQVRAKLAEVLRKVKAASGKYVAPRPAAIHKALMRLADRGAAVTIATTNFDHLLEKAADKSKRVFTYSLGAIPRPGLRADFAGILHIHGVLSQDERETSDFIVTDRDFGEFYLRRRVVPDFIYDAARLFNLVLVGYSANDAPMRYLLNAVAADGSRFQDLKERFAFVAVPPGGDPVRLEDWRGRGITPIPYDSSTDHAALSTTLVQWAKLSAVNGDQTAIEKVFRGTVRQARDSVSESERDLVDHLFRRSAPHDRIRLSKVASDVGADSAWLDTFTEIERESEVEASR